MSSSWSGRRTSEGRARECIFESCLTLTLIGCSVLHMTATEILAIQTDETVWAMYQSCFGHIGSSLRDSNGNLRSFTDEEEAFRVALRAEVKRRNLGRAA